MPCLEQTHLLPDLVLQVSLLVNMFYLQAHFYQRVIYVCLIYISGFVSVVLAPFLSSQTTPAIDALHFKDVNMVKLFKSFLAAGVICGVHHLVSLQLNNEILGLGAHQLDTGNSFIF
jgi:hypothetical protein